MSRRSSSAVQSVLIGLAIGGAALVIYRRRATLQALMGPRDRAALPAGGRAVAVSGGPPVQNMVVMATDTMRTLSTALQGGPDGLVEQARRYVATARQQLDAAIAEGQVAAAQTRQDLEARLARAKADPESARSAFK